MEYLRSLFRDTKIFYPTSEVKIWQDLKEYYERYGYEWVNLDICKKSSKIKKIDELNQEKFLKLKNHESNLRASLKGVKVPFIVPPPKPNNYDRYTLLKKWSKNRDCFNSTMAAVDLFKNFNLEPCKDYDPDNVLDKYYEEKRKEQSDSILSNSSSSITSSFSISSPSPTAPPTAPLPFPLFPQSELEFVFRKKKGS